MWSPRTRRKKGASAAAPRYVSVVEPGTTTLRLLVTEVQKEGAVVWGWAEGPGLDDGVDVAAWQAACAKIQSQAERMAQDRAGFWFLPDQMLVGLPASQLRGRGWPVVQRRARPERPIEEGELTALLERGLRLAVNRLADVADAGGSASPWLLIDAVVVELTVDGHGVTDPVGFRGREMGATVFAALAPEEVIRAWGLVARELEFSTLTLTAGPLALAGTCAAPQGLLLDVGGATTDLTWCKGGRPVMLDTLPLGGDALTAALRRKWNLSHDRAERLKRAYAAGRLGEKGRAQVLETLAPVLQTWRDRTEAALARMNSDAPLPQRLHLLGGGAALPEMADAVRSLAWSRELHFVRYPQLLRLRPTDVAGVVNRTELGRQPGDVTALALAAWGARQHRPPDRPQRILNELCRI